MSYTPTTWQSGDVITSTKLNKLEQGVADSANVLIVDCSSTTPYTLNYTFADIFNALRAGTPVYIRYMDRAGSDWESQYACTVIFSVVTHAYKYADGYRVYAQLATNATVQATNLGVQAVNAFSATGPNAYPTFLKQTWSVATSLNTADTPY